MISGISSAFGLSVANVEVGGRALILTKNSQNFWAENLFLGKPLLRLGLYMVS